MLREILALVRSRSLAAAISTALLCAGAAEGQARFQGEPVLSLLHDSYSNWPLGFERDGDGFRASPRSRVIRSVEGRTVVILPPDTNVAIGITVRGPYDFSRFEELHIWVKSDTALLVQPFTQTSGWLFRDGGDRDTMVTAGAGLTRLRIRGGSMVDPSMVETFGVQVRADNRARAAQLEIIAVTAIPRPLPDPSTPLAITDVTAPSSGARYQVYTSTFTLTRTYDNPYDPAEIDVQARFLLPSGREVVLPAFWFQDYQVVAGTERYEQYAPAGAPHWRVRFLPSEEGAHTLRLIARDKNGSVEEAGLFSFAVAPRQAPGPVRRHAGNPLHLEFAGGGLYLPRGHNLGFEDGNPDLNGTAYYRRLLTSFSSGGENWARFWMTDFSRTALEWGRAHFSGFYQGVGTYSQRAAWRVDQFLSIAEENGVQVQLVLNDHGQFSTYANARWNMGNPYASVEGGPVPQSNPELFFSDRGARDLFRRRLRYLIARWSAQPNLLAWELWNEVQFAGTPSQNFRNDAATRAAVVDWHREMSEFLKARDPFGHLVTTSSDDSGSTGFAAIWQMSGIDLVQSHHYSQPPDLRDARIREFAAAAQQAHGKPVLIAETGVSADSQRECNFDPEGFLSNEQIPVSERTVANRDHLRAGTVLRNALWSAAVSQSGAMNWWWGCYMAEDARRNRRAPDFPLNARLFPALFSFWGGEDIAAGALRNAVITTQGQVRAYGLQEPSRAYLWIRDSSDAYGTGWGPASLEKRNTENASVELSDLTPGHHLVSFYSTGGNGDLLSEVELNAPDGRLSLALPPFQGDLAVKINAGITAGSDRGWGLVPRSARTWIADGDPKSVRVNYAVLHPASTGTPVLAGAVLSLSTGETLTSELIVPAVAPTRTLWTTAEINAPSQIGLALANPGMQGASILLQLFDSEGRPLASRSFPMAAGQQMARFLSEWFSETEIPPPFRGTLQVSSDVPLAMLSLRGTTNARGEFIMTSLPSHAEESAPIFEPAILPQLTDGGGYQTEWLLLNPYDQRLTGKIRFFSAIGGPWSLGIVGAGATELDYYIPPHGLMRWITDGLQPDIQVGYARLEPSDGSPLPAGGAIIRHSPAGLRTETGIPLIIPSSTADSHWETAENLNTGIAVVNTADRPQQIRFELFLRDGSEQVQTAMLDMPAGGQISRHITELFTDLPPSARGYLRLSTARCAFLPLRVRTTPRGETLISTLLLAGAADARDRIFPQIVTGAGFQTQIILANPGPLAAEGRLILRDNSGNPSRLLFRQP